MQLILRAALLLLPLAMTPSISIAADEAGISSPAGGVVAEGLDGANTAWMLVSSALVLMMTAPGLALFYGGLVRRRNVLSVMMQCMSLMGLMSVVWCLWGYSLAFGSGVPGNLVGGTDYLLMRGVVPQFESGVSQVPMAGSIPRALHMVFQGMFFIITPALICGAFAERMKFSAMALFSVLWGTFVYCPLAHWVWSDNGWLLVGPWEAFDFAGGTVVHISSGVTALVCALVLGPRVGFGREPMPPHNLTYTCIGTALLWVGWFGFNAGSALEANASAVNAFVATHLAAASGLLTWAGLEWVLRGRPSVLGACSGAVAGLVCVTPACGTCDPLAGLILGVCGSLACYWAVTTLKQRLGYDDSLDAFGVHGVGGTVGALLTGVFASQHVTGRPEAVGLLEGNLRQFLNQGVSILAAASLAVIGSLILLRLVDVLVGLRVDEEAEIQGLDLTEHGEEGYIFL
ncbi:MAG: ammonium transporter [Planctomycetaceae bacterium]|nr:ammonium transporter [Planctomycetaceae bacterium]